MCNQQKPSLNATVINMYLNGACVHKISKDLGIHLSRVKGAIAHYHAEQDRNKPVDFLNLNFADLEVKMAAQILAGNPDFVDSQGNYVFFKTGGSPTGRQPSPPAKPKMLPSEYYAIVKAAVAQKQAETEALREINPQKYVEAMPEYEDLMQLATLALNEISKRYGSNSSKT